MEQLTEEADKELADKEGRRREHQVRQARKERHPAVSRVNAEEAVSARKGLAAFVCVQSPSRLRLRYCARRLLARMLAVPGVG